MKTLTGIIKDHNCKTCGKKITKKLSKKYEGNCTLCDMKLNPHLWGSVKMFSI